MPIPTRASPTKGNLTTSTVRRTTSREIASKTTNGGVKNVGGQISEQAATSTASKSTSSQPRVIPRPTTRTTSSTLRPTRTQSTTAPSSRSVQETTRGSSRASSASSSTTASRPATTAKSSALTRSKTSTIKVPPVPTRTASTGTTTSTTTRTAPTLPQKTKPPSTVKPAIRPLRSTKGTSTTTSLPPTRTKQPVTSSTTTSSSSTSNQPHPSTLHSELYQLTLLRTTSTQTLQAYKTSIAKSLTTKRYTLQTQDHTLHALESQIAEARSIDALDAWVHRQQLHGNSHPSRRVQTLASLIRDLEVLTDESDALAPLSVFETWLDAAMAVRDGRTPGSTDEEIGVIVGLGHTWTGAMKELVQRLTLIADGLKALSSQDSIHEENAAGVGITLVLSKHRLLAETLLGEVETALVVEEAVLRDEAVWEKDRVGRVLEELKREDLKGQVYLGAWAAG